MKVLVVNGDRYLINPKSMACEKRCIEILKNYNDDAIVDFVEPTLNDVL